MRAPRNSLVRRSLLVLCSASLAAPATAQCGIAKLLPSDGTVGRGMGRDGLAIDRGRLVAGALQGAGRAYVFEYRDGAWTETAWLERAQPPTIADRFGTSVDVEGDRVVVGAPGDGAQPVAGSVSVFERAGGTWIEAVRLEPPGGAPQDGFGHSVSLEADLLAVGAPRDDRFGTNSGAVFLYRQVTGGWQLEGVLAPPVAGAAGFGWSVATDAGRVLVGTPFVDKGSAYVYREAGASWELEQSLEFGPNHGHPQDALGWTVALDGDRAAVGAPMHGCWSGCGPIHLDDGAGAVVVFERTPAGWSQTRELIGRGDMWYREFGTTMAMHAGLVVAGAPNRSVASAMRLEPGSSDGGYRLDAGISYGGGERYGSSVAVDGDWIAVGAGNDDEAGNTAGAVYVYRRIEEFTPFCCKSIGAPFCTSAQQPVLSIDGSERTVDDCLLLHASLLPGNAVGVFLMGARENRVELPGHASALCLAGAGLLRLHPEVLSSGGDEVLSKTAGTRSIPGLASGIVPGSTWAFQAWYRKGMVKGFTNGVEVTFR